MTSSLWLNLNTINFISSNYLIKKFIINFIFKEKNKLAESNSYKSTIVNDYKNSEYAKLILNPNYKEGQRLQQQQEAIDYALTYQQYKNNAFHKMIEACSEISCPSLIRFLRNANSLIKFA